MKQAAIVPFRREDVSFGKRLTDLEGWHRTREDWERLLQLEPEGAFKAGIDHEEVGTAAAVTFERVAWIHSVIVLEEFRHRGIASALMGACVEFARARGIPTVKLDSNEGVEPFYERIGFRREFPSWRFLRKGIVAGHAAEAMMPSDIEGVLAYDRERIGLDRSKALRAIFREFPGRAFLVRERGAIRGFVVARTGERLDPVGPCVADDASTAKDLLHAALATDPQRLYRACVPGKNGVAMQLCEGLRFETESHSTRMFLGESFEESPAAFVMMSAEKG